MSEPRRPGAGPSGPLKDLDQWDDDVRRRYARPADDSPAAGPVADANGPAGADGPVDAAGEGAGSRIARRGQGRRVEEFRDYRSDTKPEVREFYRRNHRHQTVEFVRQKRRQYQRLDSCRMGIWEALELLTRMVDESDPDTEMPQIAHAMQTAEAIRRDGHPDWFVLTGLIHDLGKVLGHLGEPQWAVVGDTFPVGCAFSDKIVFAEYFDENPDRAEETYRDRLGIYQANCGLEDVLLSWGHDEYMFYVARPYLPPPALAMIRYHSFYAWHREREYSHLTDERDVENLRWVRLFNTYDLYTKDHEPPDVERLTPYYQQLIRGYFPEKIRW